MNDLPQAQFNGWAKVEVMGHQSHIGYVKTEAYGAAVLFRIDTPELPEREYELREPGRVGLSGGLATWCAAGTKIKRLAVPGSTVLVGAGSIYRIVPCTEAAAMMAIEQSERMPHILVDVPPIGLLESAGENPDLIDPDEDMAPDSEDFEEEARIEANAPF